MVCHKMTFLNKDWKVDMQILCEELNLAVQLELVMDLKKSDSKKQRIIFFAFIHRKVA